MENKIYAQIRLSLKNDTTENWDYHSSIIPNKGEMIIYNDMNPPGLKIGDGINIPRNLPFLSGIEFGDQPGKDNTVVLINQSNRDESVTLYTSEGIDELFENFIYDDATQTASGLMSAEDKTKLDNIDENANNYIHPTDPGYKHIPSGGSSGQFLGWSSSGTATWQTPSREVFVAQSSSPSNTKLLWFDTANNNILKFYNGVSWVVVPSVWS